MVRAETRTGKVVPHPRKADCGAHQAPQKAARASGLRARVTIIRRLVLRFTERPHSDGLEARGRLHSKTTGNVPTR